MHYDVNIQFLVEAEHGYASSLPMPEDFEWKKSKSSISAKKTQGNRWINIRIFVLLCLVYIDRPFGPPTVSVYEETIVPRSYSHGISILKLTKHPLP